MRILVDTNVFLDLLLKRKPFFESDVNFLELCKTQNHEIYINAMSFRDIEYVIRKLPNDKDNVKKALNGVYKLVTKIIPLTPDDAINAIFDYEKDFEDCMIDSSCQSASLDCIVTNNKKDFVNAKSKVFSVQEINNILQKQ